MSNVTNGRALRHISSHFFFQISLRGLEIFHIIVVEFVSTECVTDLDQGSDIVIFESILSTFESNVVFRGSCGSSVNWLEPKTEPP